MLLFLFTIFDKAITTREMEKANNILSQKEILSKFNINIERFVNNKDFGVLIVDIEDNIVFVNNVFCNSLGFESSELVGTNLKEHNENQDVDFFNEKSELRKRGVHDFYKITINSKKQEPVEFFLSTNPLIKNGKLVGNIGVFINVSDNIAINHNKKIEHNFTDFLSQTIIITDVKLTIKDIEKYGLNFLDIKDVKQKKGLSIFNLIDDKHKSQIDLFVKKAKGVYKDIINIKVFKNQVLSVYLNIVPLFDKDKLIGFKFIFTDLSQFTELKHKFERSEQQYKLIFQKSQSALLLFDNEKGKIFEVNNATAKLIGKKPEELINLRIDKVIRTKNNESVFELIKNNKNITNRLFYIEEKPVKIAVSFIEFYEHKNYQLSIIDYSNVVKKEQREKQINTELRFLSKTAQYFLKMTPDDDMFEYIGKSLLEVIPNSYILTASYDGSKLIVKHIAGLGRNASNILKIFPKPIIGTEVKIMDFRTKSKNMGLVNLDEYISNEGFGIYSDDIYNTVRKVANVKVHYSILITNNDEILGGISIFLKDEKTVINKELIETFAGQAGIAIQKLNLEKKLIVEKENAEGADKLKTAFLANMSHEIRTPMNTIIGFAEMLSKENISETQRKKYFNFIDNSGKVLLNLIDDIIDITKIEAGELKLINTSFLPYEVLKELYDIFKPDFKKRAIKFKLNVPTNIRDTQIFTDKYRLKQIITNLITNALKSTHKGKVEFGFDIENKNIKFFVIDTGQGISSKLQEAVFYRFNRGDVKKIQGNGLGLSISKQLTELMDGEFKLVSVENKGSSFYLTIPIVKKETKKIIIKNKELDTSWSDKKILIVDDEELNFELLNEILLDTKAQITRAKNGKEAVELCKKNNFDLVLMDVKMPIMDGFTATSLILENNPTQKIIAQTAYAMSGEKEKAIKIGCADFITKPIRSNILLTKINKIFK